MDYRKFIQPTGCYMDVTLRRGIPTSFTEVCHHPYKDEDEPPGLAMRQCYATNPNRKVSNRPQELANRKMSQSLCRPCHRPSASPHIQYDDPRLHGYPRRRSGTKSVKAPSLWSASRSPSHGPGSLKRGPCRTSGHMAMLPYYTILVFIGWLTTS